MTAKVDWLAAVERGDVEALRWHLDAGMGVDAFDGHGQTALMVSAHRGRLDAVRLLIERGAALDVSYV